MWESSLDRQWSEQVNQIQRKTWEYTWLVEHEDISYFSYKMRKSQVLLHAKKDKKKDHAEKLFNKLKHLL